MTTYDVEIFNNHIILLIGDKRALLDTGATHSLGDGKPFQFLEKNYEFMKGMLGFTLKSVAELLGTELHALLGNDVLSSKNFLVNWREKVIQFSYTPFDLPGERIPIKFFLNVPILNIEVLGKTCKAILDTGAHISYLNRELTADLEQVDEREDFYPLLGRFSTPIYEVSIAVGKENFTIEAGVLPALLQWMVKMTTATCVLGNDYFRYCDAAFNFSLQELILIKRQG